VKPDLQEKIPTDQPTNQAGNQHIINFNFRFSFFIQKSKGIRFSSVLHHHHHLSAVAAVVTWSFSRDINMLYYCRMKTKIIVLLYSNAAAAAEEE